MFAMSLDLLVGFGGMVSLGHAAFLGAGAYAYAALAVLAGWPPWPALAAAVGAFAVRLHGVFFIMVTLAIGEAAHAWILKSRAFGGGDGMAGAPRPGLAALGIDLDDPAAFSAFALAAAAVAEVGALLARLKAEGATLLLVEQNLPLALSLADSVMVLGKGELRWRGARADFAAAAAVRDLWLGV